MFFRIFAVAANLQKILDNDQITSLTFALVGFTWIHCTSLSQWKFVESFISRVATFRTRAAVRPKLRTTRRSSASLKSVWLAPKTRLPPRSPTRHRDVTTKTLTDVITSFATGTATCKQFCVLASHFSTGDNKQTFVHIALQDEWQMYRTIQYRTVPYCTSASSASSADRLTLTRS